MSQFKLIIQTFLYYWKKNLVLALGVAISTAVITGSLVVGDSVKKSLESQVGLRLGKTTHSITAGDRFFTTELADNIRSDRGVSSAPVMMLRGIGVSGGGKTRVPGVQVLGVDESFDYFANQDKYFGDLDRGEVILSFGLAEKLEVEIGDQLLFRIRKASLIPLNAPFVSDEETSVAVRVKVKAIAGEEALGRFDLRNSQSSPLNAFFNLDYLNEIMDLSAKANLILLENPEPEEDLGLDSFAGSLFGLEDYSLSLHYLQDQNKWELNSERVFIGDQIRGASKIENRNKETVFTYFVNSFNSNGLSSPYSFVASTDIGDLNDNEILINSWLAEDLKAGPGDKIELTYFVVGPLRELEEKTSAFIIKDIFGMDHPYSDSSLMPHLPGLSDAGNCSDWETGIPIDLEKIRDKDEDYWDVWKGTPKAIVSYKVSTSLWANRFGQCTAIRFPGEENEFSPIESELLSNISPEDLGFLITPSKKLGENAASQGTDFGQLFLGLSFFILLAGIILTIVLFLLGVESRSQQLGTFAIMGFSKNRIRKIIFIEGLFATVVGLIIGLAVTVFYNKLIFSALNGIWGDIVRTDALDLYFSPATLVIGLLISFLVVLLSLYLSLNRFLKRKLIELHRRTFIKLSPGLIRIKKLAKWISLLAGLGIIIFQFIDSKSEEAGMFFMAGGLLLIFFLLLADGILSSRKTEGGKFSAGTLSVRNGIRNRSRSLSIIIMFALGVFLVVTTGANHKDPYAGSSEKSSGTGGFQYMAQTTVPVLHDLNNEGVRFNYGLEEEYSFAQFRKMNGDDASCLNLNKIQQPAILGVRPVDLTGRFSFVSSTDLLDESSPWESLKQDLGDGVIPAIADQTVIQWGLGLKVGDTLFYQDELGEELKLLLIGGLANSVFQGNVMIADSYFLNHFPSSSGSSLFLLEGINNIESAEAELSRGLRDFGWDMDTAPQKLAEFNSVENTYLSIFMILGAFGLLIGTIGLGVILVRNLLERKKELAMFKALGFRNRLIIRIVLGEYFGFLIAGLLAGGISAIIAVLPGLLKPHSEVSFGFLALMLGVILLNGVIWIWVLAMRSVKKSELIAALREE